MFPAIRLLTIFGYFLTMPAEMIASPFEAIIGTESDVGPPGPTIIPPFANFPFGFTGPRPTGALVGIKPLCAAIAL